MREPVSNAATPAVAGCYIVREKFGFFLAAVSGGAARCYKIKFGSYEALPPAGLEERGAHKKKTNPPLRTIPNGYQGPLAAAQAGHEGGESE